MPFHLSYNCHGIHDVHPQPQMDTLLQVVHTKVPNKRVEDEDMTSTDTLKNMEIAWKGVGIVAAGYQVASSLEFLVNLVLPLIGYYSRSPKPCAIHICLLRSNYTDVHHTVPLTLLLRLMKRHQSQSDTPLVLGHEVRGIDGIIDESLIQTPQ